MAEDRDKDSKKTSRITEEHRALKNQSSVKAQDYPVEQRRAQSLVRAKPKKD